MHGAVRRVRRWGNGAFDRRVFCLDAPCRVHIDVRACHVHERERAERSGLGEDLHERDLLRSDDGRVHERHGLARIDGGEEASAVVEHDVPFDRAAQRDRSRDRRCSGH